MAVLATPAQGAVGDTYKLKSQGKQIGLLTVTQVHKGTILYTNDQIGDLEESLSNSLDANYDEEGEGEYAGSVDIDSNKLVATVDTSDSGSTLKEIFTQVQWEVLDGLCLGTILGDNEEDDKSPDVLTVSIQNTNTAGTVQGPCRAENDCSFFLDYA